jgi:hypothetical protein
VDILCPDAQELLGSFCMLRKFHMLHCVDVSPVEQVLSPFFGLGLLRVPCVSGNFVIECYAPRTRFIQRETLVCASRADGAIFSIFAFDIFDFLLNINDSNESISS